MVAFNDTFTNSNQRERGISIMSKDKAKIITKNQRTMLLKYVCPKIVVTGDFLFMDEKISKMEVHDDLVIFLPYLRRKIDRIKKSIKINKGNYSRRYYLTIKLYLNVPLLPTITSKSRLFFPSSPLQIEPQEKCPFPLNVNIMYYYFYPPNQPAIHTADLPIENHTSTPSEQDDVSDTLLENIYHSIFEKDFPGYTFKVHNGEVEMVPIPTEEINRNDTGPSRYSQVSAQSEQENLALTFPNQRPLRYPQHSIPTFIPQDDLSLKVPYVRPLRYPTLDERAQLAQKEDFDNYVKESEEDYKNENFRYKRPSKLDRQTSAYFLKHYFSDYLEQEERYTEDMKNKAYGEAEDQGFFNDDGIFVAGEEGYHTEQGDFLKPGTPLIEEDFVDPIILYEIYYMHHNYDYLKKSTENPRNNPYKKKIKRSEVKYKK